ncbi:hypothetical protein [Laceyella putida]|uniref:Holin n=1 Tax=Laceyella putida TaxID=110101 RepID=A0ABW2RQN1_9BACL
MDALVAKMIYFALTIVLIAAIWKSVSAYLSGKSVKTEVKTFLIICLFLGAAPGLTKVASNLGESIVAPVDAIVNFVSGEVTKDLTKGN